MAIECEKQLNAPLEEHKKCDKPTKADFDIYFNPSTYARKKKPPQEQPPAEAVENEDPNYVPLHKGKDLAGALHHCVKHCRKTEKSRNGFCWGNSRACIPQEKGTVTNGRFFMCMYRRQRKGSLGLITC